MNAVSTFWFYETRSGGVYFSARQREEGVNDTYNGGVVNEVVESSISEDRLDLLHRPLYTIRIVDIQPDDF